MNADRSLASALCLATLCAAFAGCNHGDTPAGMFPVTNDGGMIAGTEVAIRDFVIGGGTRDWVREAAPHPSAGPHGRVQTAYNNAYLAARRMDRYPMPVGAASAKELFHDDGSHQGWAMSIKVAPGDGAETWVWWEGDAPDYSSRAFGVGVYSCERCHGDSKRDRSLTATVP